MASKISPKIRFTRILSIVMIACTLLNLTLFSLRKIDYLTFWIIIGAIAAVAFLIIPKLRK